MPQVPYSPVPNVEPIQGGPGPISVSTPIEAFGGATARAIQGLGAELDKIGGEVFQRAIAIQQLNNDAEATEADTQYMIMAGKRHAEFNALEGKARVDAYDSYVKGLESDRAAIRDSMSNPMAAKMFDKSSRGTMGRTIFNGAGAAASAQKDYYVGTKVDQMKLDAKSVEDNPGDDLSFQDKVNRTIENAKAVAAAKGAPVGSPQEELLVKTQVSALWASRIIGKARTEPFEAAKILDANKAQMTEQDFLRVDNIVRGQSRAVGAANIADQVYDPDKPLKDLEEEARSKAKALNPDDPILANHAVSALQTKYNQQKYAKRQEDLDNWQTVQGGILSGVTDERQLRLDPKIDAAINSLPKEKQLSIPGTIQRYNAARDRQTEIDTYWKVKGLFETNPEEALNLDVTKEKLSQADMKMFAKLQDKLKEKPQQDPRVQRALRMISGAMPQQLEALGIRRYTDSNKDDYNRYAGAVSAAIDAWREDKGKPPTDREIIDEIGPTVLKQVNTPGAIFGDFWPNKTFPNWKPNIPNELKEKVRNDISSKTGEVVSDEQIERAVQQMQFQKLFSTKKAK